MQHTQDHSRVERERRNFQAALDEYLAAVHDAASSVLPEKKRRMLAAYVEFRYQLNGGTHCTTCNAPVRHDMNVEVRRPNGSTSRYAALCTRCLQAERAVAIAVTLRVGPVEFETLRRGERSRLAAPVRRSAAA